jgi:hypothetical protein
VQPFSVSTLVGEDISRPPMAQILRETLHGHETAPVTLLCADGEAPWNRVDDLTFWENISQPSSSGTAWGTEYVSRSNAHRGVAANRWLKIQISFCKYQKTSDVKIQNQVMLEPSFNIALYNEIDFILPSLEMILTPSLDSRNTRSLSSLYCPMPIRDPHVLDFHSKKVWEWIDMPKSKIRMLMQFQTAGGLPYVSFVHLRLTRSFKHNGNISHCDGTSVTLLEFQNCIKVHVSTPGSQSASTFFPVWSNEVANQRAILYDTALDQSAAAFPNLYHRSVVISNLTGAEAIKNSKLLDEAQELFQQHVISMIHMEGSSLLSRDLVTKAIQGKVCDAKMSPMIQEWVQIVYNHILIQSLALPSKDLT